jgi:hypothetical protein
VRDRGPDAPHGLVVRNRSAGRDIVEAAFDAFHDVKFTFEVGGQLIAP